MKLDDLKALKEEATKELEVARQKQRQLSKLSAEVEEECNARQGLVFSLDRMIALKEE